eukprot:8967287-Ditylum_brightwellii.AAC.1
MDNMLAAVNDRIASGDLEITNDSLKQVLTMSSATTATEESSSVTTVDLNSSLLGYMTDVELIDTRKSLCVCAKERIEELKDQIDS